MAERSTAVRDVGALQVVKVGRVHETGELLQSLCSRTAEGHLDRGRLLHLSVSANTFRAIANKRCGDKTARETGLVLVTHPDELSTHTDAQLIGQALRLPEQFSALFDRHYQHIYAYAARRLGPDLAEDVASETFLVAFDRRAGYDTAREDARPWLYGIASNLIARHVRAESRRYKMLARAGDDGQDDAHDDVVAGRIDALAVRGRLAKALSRLPGAERDVLLLVAWAGLSQQEAASALDIPGGTARSRLHRARQEMRKALGAEMEVDSKWRS